MEKFLSTWGTVAQETAKAESFHFTVTDQLFIAHYRNKGVCDRQKWNVICHIVAEVLVSKPC